MIGKQDGRLFDNCRPFLLDRISALNIRYPVWLSQHSISGPDIGHSRNNLAAKVIRISKIWLKAKMAVRFVQILAFDYQTFAVFKWSKHVKLLNAPFFVLGHHTNSG
jgi:hypothetical protein